MDASSFFKGKYFDMVPPVPSSRREYEASRARNKFLKRSATFSYLLLQTAIIVASVSICATPYWMRCHFFLLTPESVNATAPAFAALKHDLTETSNVEKPPVWRRPERVTVPIVPLNSTNSRKAKSTTRPPTTSTSETTDFSPKGRRRPPVDPSPTPPQVNGTLNASSLAEKMAVTNDNGSLSVMRRYVSADIGLWVTCQLGQCQLYNSLFKIFFEIDSSSWWLFICRWICTCGVCLTEILWFVVAITRFITFNRRLRRRPRIVEYRNRGLKSDDPNGYTLEPIAGFLLLFIKTITIAAIVATLLTFRWHTNVQWPVDWRAQNGVIAHMGLSWLGMIAMGSCDIWLFLVTLLHTIASRRDQRRAELEAAKRSGGVYTASAANAVRRRNSVGACGQRCGKQFCAHVSGGAGINSQDDSNFYYSPDNTNNNYYKPTPYEDDCDYGFNTIPLSRKQSVRHSSNPNPNAFDDYPGGRFQAPSTQARNNVNVLMTSHRTPGGRSHHFNNHNRTSPEMVNSPLYIPHYDDEAIGGRAFY